MTRVLLLIPSRTYRSHDFMSAALRQAHTQLRVITDG
jgi:hypothetical protein